LSKTALEQGHNQPAVLKLQELEERSTSQIPRMHPMSEKVIKTQSRSSRMRIKSSAYRIEKNTEMTGTNNASNNAIYCYPCEEYLQQVNNK
jgi:hypothetical protein